MNTKCAAILAAAILAVSFVADAANNTIGSKYFPQGTGLAGADGSLVTIGAGLSLSAASGGVLSATGSGSGGSAVRAMGYEIQTVGFPLTTAPYYLTTYAEEPGTINYARVAFLASSGANYNYVVHIVHGTSDTVVGGLNNNSVCDGESGCTAAQLATYQNPNVVAATGANTYVQGDQIYVSFNTTGGTPTSSNFHLSVTQ